MKLRWILSVVLALGSLTATAHAEQVTNDLGWSLTVADTGEYTIASRLPDWTVAGKIDKALADIKSSDGKDRIGPFKQVQFAWFDSGKRTGSIRLYQSRPLVLFSITYVEAVDHSPAPFPILTKLPEKLLEFRYGETDHLRPELFHLAGAPDEQYGGPFALFDHEANTMILSPASNFMVAMMSGDQTTGLSSGLNRTLAAVPAGYTQQTLLTIDQGINHAWDVWGNALTDLYSKKRPANDADTGLKYLGYWTDNGAYYYYNYDLQKGYANTLLAEKAHLDERGVPIHYMQLDSWWYPKTFNSVQEKSSNKPRAKDPKLPAGTWNRYGGLLEYTASPDLFPDGLGAFHKKLGLPLITHNRWIDPESVYHETYKVSGIAGVDPKWWDKIIGDIAGWGVQTYEQDWNNYIYLKSPDLYSTTWAGDAYMDGMANACAANNVTMQYCMVMPRFVMQGGAKYPNFTTCRVSGDRLDRGKWREFVYGSRMVASLGVWPWTDVYRSNETANILISTLSGGMVGLSDRMGEEDMTNIFRAVRKDGVIVKPDAPLMPVDAAYISEATETAGPIVCAATTSDKETVSAAYVFAFVPKRPAATAARQTWSVSPAALGITGPAFAYDFFTGAGDLIPAGKSLSTELDDEGWSYQIIVPVGESTMAFIGDADLFVTRGHQRIASVADHAHQLQTKVTLSKGESTVTLCLYSPTQPTVAAEPGTTSEVAYDDKTKIARVKITAGESAADRTFDLKFQIP